MKLVQVLSVQTTDANGNQLADKNGRHFRIITVQNPQYSMEVDESTGELVRVKNPSPLQATYTAWERNYLSTDTKQISDPGFDAQVGEKLMGYIEQREVEPYLIPITSGKDAGKLRKVNTFKTVVFGNTDDAKTFAINVQKAFNAAEHPFANTGKLINEVLDEEPIAITAPAKVAAKVK